MNLDRAIWIALEAHSGQIDKRGDPYIFHPLRVMLSMKTTELQIIAVLHDVVEDSHRTLQGLRDEGFSWDIVDAIDELTHRGEDYADFILRAKANPLARIVKIADISDNLLPWRNQNPTEKDMARIAKYIEALKVLTEKP